MPWGGTSALDRAACRRQGAERGPQRSDAQEKPCDGRPVDRFRQLERKHPSAAASLREGLDETLTVTRFDPHEGLARTLSTTIPIDFLNDRRALSAERLRHDPI